MRRSSVAASIAAIVVATSSHNADADSVDFSRQDPAQK